MQNIKIINEVIVSGKEIPYSELSESDRRLIAERIQEAVMSIAGYKRRTA